MGINLFDTLFNVISGLGTVKDKAAATRFTFVPMMREQQEAAYRGDWIARKVVDIPAKDATREWRSWQADSDQIEALEEAERTLGLQQKLCRAMILARLYGGAALFMGVGDNPEEELDPDTVNEGDLEYIHVLSRHELTTGPLIWDVASPWYGEPSWYERRPSDPKLALIERVHVHPSRVVRLLGMELPDITMANDGWGDSVLQSVAEAVLAASTVNASIASLIHESKIDIIQIPELSSRIGTQEYQDRLINRFARANTLKSLTNALVLDKDETWSRQEANFSGLQPLIRDYLAVAAGAADIPATRLLGESPRGMNATGVSDIRNYYDKIASDQQSMLTPALARLDEVLIRSALGARDPAIFYEWTPLWQLDDTQKADLWLKKAQVYQIDVSAGLIPEEALGEARANQLIEDGVYPGLESALESAAANMETAPPEPPPVLTGPDGEPLALPPPTATGAPMAAPSGSPAPSGRGAPAGPARDADPFHHSETELRGRDGKWRKANRLHGMRAQLEEQIARMRRTFNEHLALLNTDAAVGDGADDDGADDDAATEDPPLTVEQVQELVEKMVRERAVQPQPPPVVNVTVDAKTGKVVKTVEHDEHGRVKRIIEDDDDGQRGT